MRNPMWGCIRLSNQLKLMDISVSSPTIQKILIKRELGSKYQRLLKLEEKALKEKVELAPRQVRAIEKANPCFKERHVESSRPGELLSQDTFYDLSHRNTKVKSPQTNGFVERFNRTVLDEFFRPAFRQKFYESVEALQKDLDKWIKFYNNERPHQGYRNMGKRPFDTVNKFVKNV